MFFDLNVPIPIATTSSSGVQSKKGKGKQTSSQAASISAFSTTQIEALESRIDLLVQLGYTILAFNQVVHKKVDAKVHINVLDGLLRELKRRPGVIYLKRLTIVLDEDSEKGFGLINASISLFNSYDIISLLPTTANTFSLACLTHSLPSPLTAHIISLPLTLPRLPFRMKHTLVRTAIKNGAVFEISYVGALGGENDPCLVNADAALNDITAKRNWWAASRELCRVAKGKGLLVSGGVVIEGDLRAPRDISNIITLLDLPQNIAHDSMSAVPKSLIKRAETRKTYRAVLSEPRLVIPEGYRDSNINETTPDTTVAPASVDKPSTQSGANTAASDVSQTPTDKITKDGGEQGSFQNGQKRSREEAVKSNPAPAGDGESKKKKRKKNKEGRGSITTS